MDVDNKDLVKRRFGHPAQVSFILSFFLIMMLLLNWYNFVHFRHQFGPMEDICFWPLYIFASVSMVMGFGIVFYSSSGVARGVYYLAMAWFGFSIVLLIMLLIHDLVVMFVPVDTDVTVKAVILLVAVMTVIGMVNANILHTRRLVLRARGLKRDMRIVQVADVHLGAVHGTAYLRDIVDRVNGLRPDLVLMTGDLVDGPFKYREEMFDPLKDIEAPAYFSTGNHEFIGNVDVFLDIFRKRGLKVLRNEAVDLDNNVQLMAVDDTWEDKEVLAETLETYRPDRSKYTILMSHQPVGFKMAAEKGVDLMLSGHTHGGQFFPFTYMTKLIWRQGKGLHRHKGSYLYTTSGAGTWGPPIRMGSNSEIVLIELRRRKGTIRT